MNNEIVKMLSSWKWEMESAFHIAINGNHYHINREKCNHCGIGETSVVNVAPKFICVFSMEHEPNIFSLCPNCAIKYFYSETVVDCSTGNEVNLIPYNYNVYKIKCILLAGFKILRLVWFIISFTYKAFYFKIKYRKELKNG